VSARPARAVGWWLVAVSIAVFIQVGLGGITRLTDSGLSITEWKPLLGVIPPHDEPGWQDAFGKYQQIPQFQLLKRHLTLDEFKFIYFWEWFHRLWGRLLGVIFAVPALVFWRRKQLAGLGRRMLVLFLLGGAQGALGWFMVASGLQDLVYVSHLRLAAHYSFALFLLVALVWNAASILRTTPVVGATDRMRQLTWGLVAALAVQLTWGAFMAGLKAALMAPTWPTINGQWVPDAVWSSVPWNDPLSVHFIHRTLGFTLLAAFIAWLVWTRKVLGPERLAVVALAAVQVTLGVLVLLYGPIGDFLLWLGLAHQLVGTALTVALVVSAHALQTAPRP